MTQTYDLTRGKSGSALLGFFFPLLLTNMLQQVYTFADTAIVGKGLGDGSLAAVGNMSSLTFFIIGFSAGLTNGFSVITGQRYGASDTEGLRRSVASSISLAGGIALVLTVVSMLFLRPILRLLQTPDSILGESLTYGYIIFGGLAVTISYNLCASVLRALGDSRTPFAAIVVSSIINVVFNCVTIYGMKTGVEGPAAVTIAAQAVSVGICLRKLRKIDAVCLSAVHFRGNSAMYRKLIQNGLPMAVMNSITAVGCMTVQYFVNGMGEIFVSAYSACSKILNLSMQPAATAGIAYSSFTSQNYGAKKYDRIVEGLKVSLMIALTSYLILGSMMMFIPKLLAGLLLNGAKQIELAAGFLRRCGAMLFMVDILFVVRNGCQGMGKPLVPMLSGVLEMVLRVSVIVLLTGAIGFRAASYAEIAAWTGACAVNALALAHALGQVRAKTA